MLRLRKLSVIQRQRKKTTKGGSRMLWQGSYNVSVSQGLTKKDRSVISYNISHTCTCICAVAAQSMCSTELIRSGLARTTVMTYVHLVFCAVLVFKITRREVDLMLLAEIEG